MLSLAYRLMRCPFGLLSVPVRTDLSKDVELRCSVARTNTATAFCDS
jgi:hypothetical protein